jgi:hypothetical protein
MESTILQRRASQTPSKKKCNSFTIYIQTRKYRADPACGPIYFMGLDIRIVRQTHPSF